VDSTAAVRELLREFRRTKDLADRALAQVPDGDFFATISAETNPIAVVVKHVAGNLRSRWTDFLTTDGEKPDRDRDAEFVIGAGDGRDTLTARWEEGWSVLFATLEALRDADLERTVTIRGEPHTVIQAVLRQHAHYAYHAGQIVLLARYFAGDAWRTLSVPKGGSATFNRAPTSYLDGGEDGRGRGAPR